MKKALFCAVTLLLALSISLESLAVTPEEFFNNANNAYRAGDYETAVRLYERVRVKNALVYYNLANSHLQNGNTGLAILYYNRAFRLRPRNSDIGSNLEQARLLRKDRLEREEMDVILKILTAPYRLLSMNEHALLAVLLFTFFSVNLFALSNLRENYLRKRVKTAAFVFGVFLAVQVLLTGLKTYQEKIIKTAVITDREVPVRSSSSAGSKRLFVLHEGAEVVVGKSENGSFLVILPTGWTGWVPSLSLEII